MKLLTSAAIVVALGFASVPAFAQSAAPDATGNGPVAGEGPGGSGAGQPAGGPQKAGMKMNKKHMKKKTNTM